MSNLLKCASVAAFVMVSVSCLAAAGSLELNPEAVGWYDLAEDADPAGVKAAIEGAGGKIVMLTPEGRLLVRWGDGKPAGGGGIGGLSEGEAAEPVMPPKVDAPDGDVGKEGCGWARSSRPDRKTVDEVCERVTRVAPNELAQTRALFDEQKDRPSQVDNSVSQYFPYIGNQYSVGSCTTWSACHYWNSYTHMRDEDLTFNGLDMWDQTSSPSFLFNLLTSGVGSDILDVMAGMRDIGCCSQTQMPFTSDVTEWPSETAWIDALRRRTSTCCVIGSASGCTDAEMEAIKQHLANGNAAVVGLPCFTSWSGWEGEDKTGFNNGVLYADSGTFRAGHGMGLFGYDDNRPYYDGTTTRYGAFLVVNSWGYEWGLAKSYGADGATLSRGFMWVSYEYFKTANEGYDDNLGMAFYNEDRDNYRPKLFAVTGLNYDDRGFVTCHAGIGPTGSPAWVSPAPFAPQANKQYPIEDDQRVAIDMTDGLSVVTDPNNIQVFVEALVDADADLDGSMTSAEYHHDLFGVDAFDVLASSDPTLVLSPGISAYATAQFARGSLAVTPGLRFDRQVDSSVPPSFMAAGPEGGPFSASQTYTLTNMGTAALNWTASTPVAWLGATGTSGSLAPGAQATVDATVTASADALSSGVYTESAFFADVGAGSALRRAAELTVRPMNRFHVSVSPIEGPLTLPLTVEARAIDIGNSTIRLFEEPVGLQAFARTGETSIVYPPYDYSLHYAMDQRKRASRYQQLYYAGELGGSGTLTALSLNVSRAPAQPLLNWAIRLQNTSLGQSTDTSFQATGWTTVYEANEDITGAGWWQFSFDRPFEYNGVDNLLVDFSSFGYSERATAGTCYWGRSESDTSRSTYWYTDDPEEDPRLWDGTLDAMGGPSVLHIKFERGEEVAISPEQTSSFTDGAWSGSLNVLEEARNARLYAVDGNGRWGSSNLFGAFTGSDADGDGLSYEDETADLDPDTPGTQNPFDPNDGDSTGDNGSVGPDGIPDGMNDWDGDGMTNAEEFQWGYDPLDPLSYTELTLAVSAALCAAFLMVMLGLRFAHRRAQTRQRA